MKINQVKIAHMMTHDLFCTLSRVSREEYLPFKRDSESSLKLKIAEELFGEIVNSGCAYCRYVREELNRFTCHCYDLCPGRTIWSTTYSNHLHPCQTELNSPYHKMLTAENYEKFCQYAKIIAKKALELTEKGE